MVARLQKCLVLGYVLVAIAWTTFGRESSRVLVVSGLFALMLAHAAILGVEFVASYRVNGLDSAPRASAVQCLKAWLAESWIAPRVFGWRQPFRSCAVPDHLPSNSRRGVVLVHGYLCNRGFWNPWLRALRIDDRAFVAVNLEPLMGSIDNYAQAIEDAVVRVKAATSLSPMLICHSMGGLVARAWLRDFNSSEVSRIVTIGTPHRGTWFARFAHSINGRQMRVGGDWLLQFEGASTEARQIPFTCWYSNCDNIVFPTSTATLPGADNRLIEGRGHVEMAFDARLMTETLELLDR